MVWKTSNYANKYFKLNKSILKYVNWWLGRNQFMEMIVLDLTREPITYVNRLSEKTKLYIVYPLNKYHPLTSTTYQLNISRFLKRCLILCPNFIAVIVDVHWYLEQNHDKVLKLDINVFPIKEVSIELSTSGNKTNRNLKFDADRMS